ncbi:MAG: HepT-like ribonuclease domain-containing protein [Candidatus Hydrogenedentota bacterium]
MDDGKNKVELLKEYFKKRDDIVMAFLFGSRTKNSSHSQSDWDIAIYLKPDKQYVEIEEQDRAYEQEDVIWNDCIKILNTDNVDLIILNRAPVNISDTAIRGKTLIIKDHTLYLLFMLAVTREAEDYRKFVNEYYSISQRSTSFSSADRVILQKSISFVEEQMTLYPYFNNLTLKEYTANIHKRNDVERWVENIVNAVIDMSKIILASRHKIIPDTYREVIVRALVILKLSENYISKFEKWIKLRNILAHEYLDIRWGRIEDFIKTSEPVVNDFLSSLKTYL